jgi:hypothetical protein
VSLYSKKRKLEIKNFLQTIEANEDIEINFKLSFAGTTKGRNESDQKVGYQDHQFQCQFRMREKEILLCMIVVSFSLCSKVLLFLFCNFYIYLGMSMLKEKIKLNFFRIFTHKLYRTPSLLALWECLQIFTTDRRSLCTKTVLYLGTFWRNMKVNRRKLLLCNATSSCSR